MNKLYLFLAFAVFALVACSEDKPPQSHSELCKNIGQCLVGKWFLQSVIRPDDNPVPLCQNSKEEFSGELRLKADGTFFFNGGKYNSSPYGKWSLNKEGEMEIEFERGTYNDQIPQKITATLEIRSSGEQLRVSTPGYTSFSQCYIGGFTNLIEVYSWQGPNTD